MTDALLTVDQVASRLSVAPITIRRMIKRGDLPAVRVGRAIRIDPRNLPEAVVPVPTDITPETHQILTAPYNEGIPVIPFHMPIPGLTEARAAHPSRTQSTGSTGNREHNREHLRAL